MASEGAGQGSSGKKRRRRFSAHQGVVVLRRRLPSGRTAYLARWRDPATGDRRFVSFDKLGIFAPAERTAWARERAQQLLAERAAMASGKGIRARVAIKAAVEEYLAAGGAELRPSTLVAYRASLALFQTWADGEGLRRMEELDAPALARFRSHLVALPKRAAKRKGRRGEKRTAPERRSPRTAARDLRQVSGFLRYAVRHGLAPRLSKDAISDALKPPRGERKIPDFLPAAEIRLLLEASLRHDAATFAATRAEHAGESEPGSTPRHAPLAPAVVLSLLLGMRLGELAAMTWRDVDLGALDERGEEVGEIRVRAAISKTKAERRIDLGPSPAARALLGALRLRCGGKGTVLGLTAAQLEAGGKRLRARFGAPTRWSWHCSRRTTSTFLVNAGGIFGAASAFRAAKLLGHGVQVAERNYSGLIAVSRDARTLEAAMQIEELVGEVIARASSGSARKVRRKAT